MRETENLEFIAVGPWGVPSPCVRTSRVLCRKTVCGPRSTGRFCTASPSDPYHSPTAVCRAQTTVWSVCAAQDLLPHESHRAGVHVLQQYSTGKLSVRLPYKTPF